MTAAKFIFETDFRQEAHGRRVSDVDVATAREQGFQDGFAQGREAARTEANAALTHMAGLIARQAEDLLAGQDGRMERIETEAAALAVLLARRLAGAALEVKPLALIEEAARACIVHARATPHLAVRVNETFVDEAEKLFGRLTRDSGYAGKVIILGEPEIAPGDARFEWADGGVVIDRTAIDSAVSAAALRILGQHPEDILS